MPYLKIMGFIPLKGFVVIPIYEIDSNNMNNMSVIEKEM
jgi:hypothetical protein